MRVSDEVLAILSKYEVEGNILFLPQGQLDRKTYLAVNKCLVNIGGKWDRKAKGHVFDHDPSDDLDSMLLTGETVDMKKVYQFFPTPKNVAEQMCGMAELDANCVVLESSCGRGDLADVIYSTGVANLLGVELNPDMRRYLVDKPYRTEVGVDFLQFAEIAENQGTFTRIVMNPPFSKHQDVDHILAAYKLLVPGGILVSVSSPSPFWRTDRKTVEFQNWIQEVNAQVVDKGGLNTKVHAIVDGLGNCCKGKNKGKLWPCYSAYFSSPARYPSSFLWAPWIWRYRLIASTNLSGCSPK